MVARLSIGSPLAAALIVACSGVADVAAQPSLSWKLNHSPLGGSLGPRDRHALVYDVARQRAVLFGGQTSSFVIDTWEWDGVVWAERFPPRSPFTVLGVAMAYDAARQRTVLFGGQTASSVGETWEWNGISWIQRTRLGDPGNRIDASLAYDPVRQRVVLFGGAGYSDTWEWDGTSWTEIVTTQSPTPRNRARMAYDHVLGRVLLFGGAGTGGGLLGTCGPGTVRPGINSLRRRVLRPGPNSGWRPTPCANASSCLAAGTPPGISPTPGSGTVLCGLRGRRPRVHR